MTTREMLAAIPAQREGRRRVLSSGPSERLVPVQRKICFAGGKVQLRMSQRKALVVGGGIIGLTTARALQERGFEIVVHYGKKAEHATSGGSGGYWMPFHAQGADLVRWAEVTLKKYESEPFVEKLAALSLFAASEAPEMPKWGACANMRVLQGREDLEKALSDGDFALPEGYESAFHFETVVVDSPRYCAHLEALIVEEGGLVDNVLCTDLVAAAESIGANVVVNCSGLNGGNLARDDAWSVIPGRGVVLRYARPANCTAVITTEDAPLASETEPAYVIPRGDVLVVGGTYNEGDSSNTPTDAEVARLQKVAKTFAPALAKVEPLTAWVGHRPVRPKGVRVEVSAPDAFVVSNPDITVAHNYGHGGSGFTLAWGCAADIADAIQKRLGLTQSS